MASERMRTLAEMVKPMEGKPLEFWCHRMACAGARGTGIEGYFRDGRFWSKDGADHYGCGEVVQWSSLGA